MQLLELTCDRCGVSFERKTYDKPRPDHWGNFCSRACAHFRPDGRYREACDGCGMKFEKPKLMRKRNNAVFCTVECKRKHGTRRDSKPYDRTPCSLEKTCTRCDVGYTATSVNSKYCSSVCRVAAKDARQVVRLTAQASDGLYNGKRRLLKHVMLKTQPTCALCGVDFSTLDARQIHVDHDHVTGAIRGLLCHNCNVGLGHFKDSVVTLSNAITYLQTSALREMSNV